MGCEQMETSRMDFSQHRERSMGDAKEAEAGGSRGGPQRIRNVLTRRLVREIYAMRPVKPKAGQTASAMQGFPFFSQTSQQMSMYGTGASYKESCTKVSNRLAAIYNVNAKTVRDIWNRRSWQAATRDMWTEDEKAQYRSRPALTSDDASQGGSSKNNSPSAGPTPTRKKEQHPPPFHRAGSSSSSSSGSNKTGTTAEASPPLNPQEYQGSSSAALTEADRQLLSMLQSTSAKGMSDQSPAMLEANAILEQYLARAVGRGGKVDLSILDQVSKEFPGHLQPTKQDMGDHRSGSRDNWLQSNNNRFPAQGKFGDRVKTERGLSSEPGGYRRRGPNYDLHVPEFPSPPSADHAEPSYFLKEETDSQSLRKPMGGQGRHGEQREIPDWQFPSQNTSQDPFNPEWSSLPMW
mmetsp:Transcript_24264/g.38130  ORF Transcript_24264/g.38130 Transcript_24264/m.38130 type:complete len:407 (-) Transcript_24264:582-1802(-)